MRTYGLIGYPLTHSFSKAFFAEKFARESVQDAVYELFSLGDIEQLTGLLTKVKPSGLNVTIPYKVAVMSFVDRLDPAAAAIGAVNCLKVEYLGSRQQITGYNTDAYGFEESLKPFLKAHHTKALILGDGGAANAVKYVLNKLNISYKSVLRSEKPGALLYSELSQEIMESSTLIINTTPLGTYPNVEACPQIPYKFLNAKHLAYDLVYNPEVTLFLKKAKEKGAETKNGFEMLQLQAERSWEIWSA